MAGNHMSTLSPRQRMINMMYLVLTALLALNVSKEVLDAFFRVDQTLTVTVSDKIEDADHRYEVLQKKADNNPAKVGDWNDMAKELKRETESVEKFVDSVRYELWKAGGPTFGDGDDEYEITPGDEDSKRIPTEPKTKIVFKADTHSPQQIMLGPGGEGGAGVILKQKINDYKAFVLSLIDKTEPHTDSDRAEVIDLITHLFNTDDIPNESGGSETWEEHEYNHYPLIGVMTFLNQTRLDIRTAEDKVLQLIENKTGSSLVSIDKQIPYAKPNSNYVMQGDSLYTELFLAGIDTKTLPEYDLYEMLDGSEEDHYHPFYPKGSKNAQILPKGTKIDPVIDSLGNILEYNFIPDTTQKIGEIGTDADGMGIYKEKMSSTGIKNIGGFVSVPSDRGNLIYPWFMEIKVEKPMPVIAATALNVIYTGIDNPFTINAPGHDPSDLQLKHDATGILKVTSTRDPGKFTLFIDEKDRPKIKKNKGKIKLIIYDKKTKKNVGTGTLFVAKKKPDPITNVDKQTQWSGDNAEMSMNDISKAIGLYSVVDESFVYALTYTVSEYSMRYFDNRGNEVPIIGVKGNKFDDDRVRSGLESLTPGKVVEFFDIKTTIKQNGKKQPGENAGRSIRIKIIQ